MTAQNLVAAALFAQFIFLVILVITSILGLLFIRMSMFVFLLIALALITLGTFLFSDALIELWSPLFGNTRMTGVAGGTAISTMLIADMFCVSILVGESGGVRKSPFTAALFLLPTLAIFLREPVLWVIGYAVVSAVLMTMLMRRQRKIYDENDPGDVRATGFMNVACLALGTWIGLLTRPLA